MNGIKIQEGLDGNWLAGALSTGMFGSRVCLEYDLQIAEIARLNGFLNQFGVTVEPILEHTIGN